MTYTRFKSDCSRIRPENYSILTPCQIAETRPLCFFKLFCILDRATLQDSIRAQSPPRQEQDLVQYTEHKDFKTQWASQPLVLSCSLQHNQQS